MKFKSRYQDLKFYGLFFCPRYIDSETGARWLEWELSFAWGNRIYSIEGGKK